MTVKRKGARTAIAAGPACIEANTGRPLHSYISIPTSIANGDLLARLALCTIPEICDVLIAWKSKRQRPTIDRRCSSIGHRNVRRETTRPLT